METYKKLNENEVEITTTVESKTVVSLTHLNYERDSLVRTMENNLREAADRNVKVQSMIDELDARISKFKAIGVVETVEESVINSVE